MVQLLRKFAILLLLVSPCWGQTLQVPNGGSARKTLAAHGFLVGEGTDPINVVSPAADSVPLWQSATSDPVATAFPNCLDTAGNHLNYSAATHLFSCGTSGSSGPVYPGAGVANSTGSAWGTSYSVGASANNLPQLDSGGKLLAGELPAPGASTLGGVESKDCTSGGQFVQKINTDGTETCATPSGSGLSNVAMPGDLFASSITSGMETVTKQNQNAGYFARGAQIGAIQAAYMVATTSCPNIASSSTPSCTLSQATGAGHLIHVLVTLDTSGTSHVTGGTDNKSDSYTINGTGGNFNASTALFFANSPAGVTSVTVNLNAPYASGITVDEYANVATVSPVDVTSAGSGYKACSTNTLTGPSITTSNATDLVIGNIVVDGAPPIGTLSALAPFIFVSEADSADAGAASQFYNATVAGTYAPVQAGCTFSGHNGYGITEAFKLSTSAPSGQWFFGPPFATDFTNIGIGATYDHSGLVQNSTFVHSFVDNCTMGTSCAVTLVGKAIFSSLSSYGCWATPTAATTVVTAITYASGSSFTILGTGTDPVRYGCSGD